MKLFIIFIFSTISNWNSSFMYFTFYKIQRYRNFLCKNYLLSKHIMLALCTCAALGTLQHQRGWCLFILTKEARILLWLQRIAAHPMRRSRLWCADRGSDAPIAAPMRLPMHQFGVASLVSLHMNIAILNLLIT